MPELSRFYGIVIAMFYNDHPPPHFHARYGGEKATIVLDTLDVLEGQLPRRALELVREWASLHLAELRANWESAQVHRTLESIEPLE